MGAGTRSFTAHTSYKEQTGRAQVRRGGAELRATLGALREAGPSDRSGHCSRGLYDTALAGGTGRSRRRGRRLSGTESVGADFSRNRVARIRKPRACALPRWPAAREEVVASVKAGAASIPRYHERDLSEDRGDRSRGKGRSLRFRPGPSITSAALPLLRCSVRGVKAWFPPQCHRLPSLTQSKPALPQPLTRAAPIPELLGLGPLSFHHLPLCSASHTPHPALANPHSGFRRMSPRYFWCSCFSLSHTTSVSEVLSRYSLPTAPDNPLLHVIGCGDNIWKEIG